MDEDMQALGAIGKTVMLLLGIMFALIVLANMIA